MQDMVGFTCNCGSWGRDEHRHCDRCGDGIRDDNTRTVTVRIDGSETHTLRFCPACLVNWRDRFERELVPESNGDDSDIIVA